MCLDFWFSHVGSQRHVPCGVALCIVGVCLPVFVNRFCCKRTNTLSAHGVGDFWFGAGVNECPVYYGVVVS